MSPKKSRQANPNLEETPPIAPEDFGIPDTEAENLDAPIFVISVAAQMTGMHPQTLRQYDRLGLVRPQRTRGGGRRYSPRDLAKLQYVQRLSQDLGINLAGIRLVLQLGDTVATLRQEVEELRTEIRATHVSKGRVFMADGSGRVLQRSAGAAKQAKEEAEAASAKVVRQLVSGKGGRSTRAPRADLVLWGGARTNSSRVLVRRKTILKRENS